MSPFTPHPSPITLHSSPLLIPAQWMLCYFAMHGAIHMSWGYKFRVPFTALMNIAYLWMRHHAFCLSWVFRAAEEKQNKGRRIGEAVVYLLIVFNLVVMSPRALTIGITSLVQPLVMWPMRFWVDDWRRPPHLLWFLGFTAFWWTFSYLVKKEVEAGSSCTWKNTHLTTEIAGIAGNLCLAVFVLRTTADNSEQASDSKKSD